MRTAVHELVLLALALFILLVLFAAVADAAPAQVSSFPFNGTVAAAGTFQQVLGTDTSRAGGVIYNASSDTLQVYAGPAASQAVMAAQALPLASGATENLDIASGAAIQSAVWVSGPIAGDAFIGAVQR